MSQSLQMSHKVSQLIYIKEIRLQFPTISTTGNVEVSAKERTEKCSKFKFSIQYKRLRVAMSYLFSCNMLMVMDPLMKERNDKRSLGDNSLVIFHKPNTILIKCPRTLDEWQSCTEIECSSLSIHIHCIICVTSTN